jgi:hypothetical protein
VICLVMNSGMVLRKVEFGKLLSLFTALHVDSTFETFLTAALV